MRAYLEAGADVVVPTRTQARADEFRGVLGNVSSDRLHLVVHDYTTFTGAESLAAETADRLGGIDDVIAPIGGWWAGKRLWEIDQHDWQSAFVGLATAHMAVARAVLPRLTVGGTYQVVVGDSAATPIPGSGLVSMEQAAVLMMRRALAAEVTKERRIFGLILGPVRSRISPGEPGWVSGGHIGAVATAASVNPTVPGQEFHLGDRAEAQAVLATLMSRRP